MKSAVILALASHATVNAVIISLRCDPHSEVINTALDIAQERVEQAIANVQVDYEGQLYTYFMDNAGVTQGTVQTNFIDIQDGLSDGSNTGIDCITEYDPSCTNTRAFVYQGGSTIFLCPDFFTTAVETTGCSGKSQSGVLIHEAGHLQRPALLDKKYGYPSILSIPAEDAIVNADTYMYYAVNDLTACPAEGVASPP